MINTRNQCLVCGECPSNVESYVKFKDTNFQVCVNKCSICWFKSKYLPIPLSELFDNVIFEDGKCP